MYNSVPSEPNVMNNGCEKITNDLQNISYKECVVNQDNIKHAVRSLKPVKSDGDVELWSNHVKYGGDLLCDHISKLITVCLCMSIVLTNLLTASITSLVKDKHWNYCDSTNYPGIALTSCITKIYDIIIIGKYHNHLDTSSLQFSFTTNHSTTMCNLTMKDIVTYYINRGSKAYLCLDASKAFDTMIKNLLHNHW